MYIWFSLSWMWPLLFHAPEIVLMKLSRVSDDQEARRFWTWLKTLSRMLIYLLPPLSRSDLLPHSTSDSSSCTVIALNTMSTENPAISVSKHPELQIRFYHPIQHCTEDCSETQKWVISLVPCQDYGVPLALLFSHSCLCFVLLKVVGDTFISSFRHASIMGQGQHSIKVKNPKPFKKQYTFRLKHCTKVPHMSFNAMSRSAFHEDIRKLKFTLLDSLPVFLTTMYSQGSTSQHDTDNIPLPVLVLYIHVYTRWIIFHALNYKRKPCKIQPKYRHNNRVAIQQLMTKLENSFLKLLWRLS